MDKQNKMQDGTVALRIIAAFFVVCIHTSASYGNSMPAAFYNAIARFSVPVFVMISGFFMLSKQRKYADIFRKALRLFFCFLIWSAIYIIFDMQFNGIAFDGILEIFRQLFLGPIHLWYLYMTIALYLFTPFLYLFCKAATPKDIFYFLMVCFVLGSVLYMIGRTEHFMLIQQIAERMKLDYSCGFIFCYVFGFYISKYELKKQHRIILYGLGLIATCFTIGAAIITLLHSGQVNQLFFSFFAPNVIISSMAAFVFFQKFFQKYKENILLEKISSYTLGIYFIHPIFLQVFLKHFSFLHQISPLVSIPILTVLSFLSAMLITAGLRQIKILKKIL